MSDYDQTKGELCPKCGWAMKFPDEPCRCELERENAALRADRERLDYLLENCGSFVLEDYTTGNRDLYHINASRAAIDAARAKEDKS